MVGPGSIAIESVLRGHGEPDHAVIIGKIGSGASFTMWLKHISEFRLKRSPRKESLTFVGVDAGGFGLRPLWPLPG